MFIERLSISFKRSIETPGLKSKQSGLVICLKALICSQDSKGHSSPL